MTPIDVSRATSVAIAGALRPRRERRRSHLECVETEAICVMREVGAEFDGPGIVFPGRKDSIVMVRLVTRTGAVRPLRAAFYRPRTRGRGELNCRSWRDVRTVRRLITCYRRRP